MGSVMMAHIGSWGLWGWDESWEEYAYSPHYDQHPSVSSHTYYSINLHAPSSATLYPTRDRPPCITCISHFNYHDQQQYHTIILYGRNSAAALTIMRLWSTVNIMMSDSIYTLVIDPNLYLYHHDWFQSSPSRSNLYLYHHDWFYIQHHHGPIYTIMIHSIYICMIDPIYAIMIGPIGIFAIRIGFVLMIDVLCLHKYIKNDGDQHDVQFMCRNHLIGMVWSA